MYALTQNTLEITVGSLCGCACRCVSVSLLFVSCVCVGVCACVNSKRLRVCRQNARVECDTGVLAAHTEAF